MHRCELNFLLMNFGNDAILTIDIICVRLCVIIFSLSRQFFSGLEDPVRKT